MAKQMMELNLEYRGSVAQGIKKFEKMRPHVERMIAGTLHFEGLFEGKKGFCH